MVLTQLSAAPSEILRSSHWPWNYNSSVHTLDKQNKLKVSEISKSFPPPTEWRGSRYLSYKIAVVLLLKHTMQEDSYSLLLLFLISEELCLFYTSWNEKRVRHSIFSAFVSKINDRVLLLSPWLIPEIHCQFRLAQCQDLTHSKNSWKIAMLHLIS